MPTPKKGARLGGSPAHQRLILSNLPWSETRTRERAAIVSALRKGNSEAAYDATLRRTQSSEREILATLLQTTTVNDANLGVEFAKA